MKACVEPAFRNNSRLKTLTECRFSQISDWTASWQYAMAASGATSPFALASAKVGNPHPKPPPSAGTKRQMGQKSKFTGARKLLGHRMVCEDRPCHKPAPNSRTRRFSIRPHMRAPSSMGILLPMQAAVIPLMAK